METYTIELYGLKRTLPLVQIGRHTKLANFTLLGDIELVDALADAFTEKLRGFAFDYLVAVEVKVVPLVHGIAKQFGHKRFVVCRKRVKPYMEHPIIIRPPSDYPKHVLPLVINGRDAETLKGKRVIVMDDVVSTGMTMRLMHALMERVGATVVASAAVLRQGEQYHGLANFLSVGELPIINVEAHLRT